MDGVTFPAWRDGRYVELAEILELLQPTAATLSWRLAIEEAVSTSARGAADRLVDDVEMTLPQLLEMTAEVQIIDGRVIGRKVGTGGDVVVVGAVDSTWWDVYAADSGVLRVLRAAFPDAGEIPR